VHGVPRDRAAGNRDGGEGVTAAAKSPESVGDQIFTFAERQDRIYERMNKKIERLNHRLTELEEQGRS